MNNTVNSLVAIPIFMSCSFAPMILAGNNFQPTPVPKICLSQSSVVISNANTYRLDVSSYTSPQPDMTIDERLFMALCDVANKMSSNIKDLDEDIANAVNENFWDLLV